MTELRDRSYRRGVMHGVLLVIELAGCALAVRGVWEAGRAHGIWEAQAAAARSWRAGMAWAAR